ncbi:MAG: hypothetical protein OEW19_08975 [Acidobacteriota bacterium]|nr:hypothetical protein [Acidobacteriota bacterium]
MRRRPVRVLLVLLTVVVTAAAAWRATTTEQVRSRARLADQQVDARAADAVYALAELRAALGAYVAPGQGIAFWSKQAEEQLGRVRLAIAGLEEASAAARYPLDNARAVLDRLASAESSARALAADGRLLLAGDVIFGETGDLIDTVAAEVSGARQALARAASAREAGSANAQSLLAGGVLSVWMVVLMLLVPLPGDEAPAGEATLQAASVSLSGPVDLGSEEPAAGAPPTEAGAPASPPPPDIESLAALCGELGKVSEVSELEPLLGRAAALVEARGLMVWLAGPEGKSLVPAAACGYDPQFVDRLGSIARDADNLTASAFRSGVAEVFAATPDHPAAVAVPLQTATGPGGVLAAELQPGLDHDLRQVAALAGVVAAQLANLFPAPPVRGDEPESTPAPQ